MPSGMQSKYFKIIAIKLSYHTVISTCMATLLHTAIPLET